VPKIITLVEQTKEQSGGTQKKLDRENHDKMTLL
jgi:hypothetical protein